MPKRRTPTRPTLVKEEKKPKEVFIVIDDDTKEDFDLSGSITIARKTAKQILQRDFYYDEGDRKVIIYKLVPVEELIQPGKPPEPIIRPLT